MKDEHQGRLQEQVDIEQMIGRMARDAKTAARQMGRIAGDQKNQALRAIAAGLQERAATIVAANARDVELARRQGLSPAMIDRLTITAPVLAAMVKGITEVIELADPVGALGPVKVRPNGLEVGKMRIPWGVIGIIYESRPNVTIDAASLCLKAGNAVILLGGSEALHSNQALAAVIADGLASAGIDSKAVQIVPLRQREAVQTLLQQEEYIDLIIPRGGEGLIRFVVANSKIPVLKHYKGVCHVYVDKGADPGMAARICLNAKVQRPGVCNAMETLLVHRDEAAAFLPVVARCLVDAGVELRGCPRTCAIVPQAKAAVESDWSAEFLDLILAVRVVDDLDAAMAHIAAYGSNHTEAIVTNDAGRGARFVREVDSSVVLVNASTRFNDGGQLGLGAEIGISTSKLHAFGPMGVEELTTTKFVVHGKGQVRE